MTTSGYRAWLSAIRARAGQTCGGRLAVITEGGYDLEALRACLDVTVDVLHGPVAADSVWRDAGGPDRRGRDTVLALQSHPARRPRALTRAASHSALRRPAFARPERLSPLATGLPHINVQPSARSRDGTGARTDTYVLCVAYCVPYTMSRTAQDADAAIFDNLKGEMRRGYLVASVLAALNVEQYGYSLRKRLADEGLEVDEGTLYPLLRRLETQGLLVSEWREEGKRNKRFYRLSSVRRRDVGPVARRMAGLDAALNGLLREFPR